MSMDDPIILLIYRALKKTLVVFYSRRIQRESLNNTYQMGYLDWGPSMMLLANMCWF